MGKDRERIDYDRECKKKIKKSGQIGISGSHA